MIAWLLPGALVGLLAALGPLLIHLLQRRQSRRAIVPTVRFVPAVSQSALRIRPPDDLLLLVLRTAAIVAAVVALAGPILLTPARRDAWDGRVVRAVVVDGSPSAASPQRDEAVASELQSAFAAIRIDESRIDHGLRRATAWLTTAPPGRREVVVLSDFQVGSIAEAEIRQVSASVGLRFVRLPATVASARIEAGYELIDGRARERIVTLDGWATAMNVAPSANEVPALRIEGTSPEEAARLERIVRTAGVVWPRSAGQTVIRFGTTEQATPRKGSDAAGAQAMLRLFADPAVRDITFSAAVSENTLVVSTSVDPSSYPAAALVHAALGAWRDPRAHIEAEIQQLPDATLQAWTRPAAPVDASAWRYAEQSDGRWFWVVSLIGLAAESWLRRRTRVREADHARAA